MKPADAVVVIDAGRTVDLPYPSLTHNLHPEIELVVAIGLGGKNILANQTSEHIYGYAVGLDMTRRDLQLDMKNRDAPGASARVLTKPRPSAQSPRPARCPALARPRSPCMSTGAAPAQPDQPADLECGRDHCTALNSLGTQGGRPDIHRHTGWCKQRAAR